MKLDNLMGEIDKKKLNEYVGLRIKEERKKKKLNQKELAAKVGIQNSTLSQYEHGKSEPNQEILFKIAKALDVNVSDLIPSDYREGNDEFERALKLAKDFDLQDMTILKKIIEKAISLDGTEREKFFDNLKFAIEYYEKTNDE